MLLSKIKINEHLTPDGSIDYESLKAFIAKEYAGGDYFDATCWFAGVVFVAAAYVLVVHAAAAMTYVGVAWVAAAAGAVTVEFGVTNEARRNTRDITYERLVNDLASMGY